jgi:tetratricopeptide (TPR) repeat protein
MTNVMLGSAVVAAHYVQRGIDCFRANQFERAILAFDAALQLNPDDPYARWNRATALLSMGDYARGFPEHDVAWRLFHWRGFGPVGHDIDRINYLPLWRGENEVRLLVYHELGFGDAIMAMRYVPELTRRAEVTLLIDPSLARLARSFDVEVTTKVPDDLTDFDARLPLFGVMSVLGVTAETIPSEPYIAMPVARRRMDRRNVGIAWSGRTQTGFTLERFLSLFAYSGFELYSLQPGVLADARVDPLRPGSDFADVADRISSMDHIVSVDTAAIHLAGAMGHPSTHLVLPFVSDWRWWHTELWYPNVKTYRQDNAADWSAPFAKLNEALQCISRPAPG